MIPFISRLKTGKSSLQYWKSEEWLFLGKILCGNEHNKFFWDVGDVLFLDLGDNFMSLFSFENNLS